MTEHTDPPTNVGSTAGLERYLKAHDAAFLVEINSYGATRECLAALLEFLTSVGCVECFEHMLSTFYRWYAGPDTIPTPHKERDLLIGWAAGVLFERDECATAADLVDTVAGDEVRKRSKVRAKPARRAGSA
jgi:hypothetical protein